MSTAAQRSARADLDSARPAVARLDTSRGAEDLAADLIETWAAIEAALRSLVGSTVLTGQPLIREARQRQLITFDQANTLAEFQAVRDRLQDTSYHPNDADLNSARGAFLKLDAALLQDAAADASTVVMGAATGTAFGAGPGPGPRPSGSAARTADVRPMPAAAAETPVKVVGPPRRFPVWMLATLGVVVVALIAIVGYFALPGRGGGSLQQGIDAYRSGKREVAVSAFTRAAREDPKAPLPHVYLARMAREVGNFPLANQELQLALQNDPANAAALREMGANLLAQGNNELARRFYIRAVEADPTDKTALGYLGCTLMRLNRTPEATNFLNRAGPGPWSNCTPTAPTTQPGQVAPARGAVPR